MVVDAADTEKVQIVLQNVSIDCSDHAALFIKQADKVFLTLAEGTENTLSSGSSYALGDDDSNVDGVIFQPSRPDDEWKRQFWPSTQHTNTPLSPRMISSSPEVSMPSRQKTAAAYTAKTVSKITGGAFTIATGTDAIQANNAEKADQGYVYISGGTFDLTAGTDAVQAETVLRIDGGTFQITSGGGSANASIDKSGKDSPGWGMWGPQSEQNPSQDAESTDTSDSAKGLKAGASLSLRGGTFSINSSDDSIHSNGTVTITGGTLSLKSGDDGVHAGDALLIEEGTIKISQSYEGLEGLSVTIAGG